MDGTKVQTLVNRDKLKGLVALSGSPREEHSWFYLLRLIAFLVIIAAAVINKNIRRKAA